MNHARSATSPLQHFRFALLFAAIALLPACQQTRFEAAPSGELSSCDQRWVGAWRVESPREHDDSDGPIYWVVSKDCTNYQMLEPDGPSDDQDEFTLRYIRNGGQDFIVDLPKGKGKDSSDWDNAFMVVRYQFHGADQVSAFDVDNQHVARLIIDAEIAGRTEARSKAESGRKVKLESVENMVYGPSSTTDAVIHRKGVFNRKPWLILTRASAEEMAKAQIKMHERRNPESG